MTDDPVIVIGATGGVGASLARRLRAAGRSLHLVGRQPDRLAEIAAELGATSAVADVCNESMLAAAVAAAGPRLSGLAYCVGSIDLRPLRRVGQAEMIAAFTLNAAGAALSVKAAQPALKAAGGAVVLFSSVAVAQGFANHTIVSAAKGAVDALVRALAVELAPDVRVNGIAPSLTRTPLAAPLLASPAMADGIAAMHALQRLGEPADIAAAAAFLLSADATWITGQILGVDGGRSSLRYRA